MSPKRKPTSRRAAWERRSTQWERTAVAALTHRRDHATSCPRGHQACPSPIKIFLPFPRSLSLFSLSLSALALASLFLPWNSTLTSELTPQETSERFPQWTHDETVEFLAIRAQLDKSFVETKRNKPLWQAISSLLQQRGFFRTPDQCKSKWKNLVTRFKGSESVEGEINRQFPFYEEMRKIFSDRMERLLVLEKARGKQVQVHAKEWEEEEGERKVAGSKKRRKVERKKRTEEEVEGAVRDFMRRQLEMEARWAEAVEARDTERRAKEEQWRRVMQGLQEERTDLERRWREREEERRVREEARAERRHALLIALLDKLVHRDC